MAATDYAGMVARWEDALATDSADTEFTARLPALIGDAELRCYRDLDPLAVRRVDVTLTPTPGTRTLAVPADCWLPRRLMLLTSTTRTPLLRRDLSFLDEYWSDASVTGTPKYWTLASDGVLALAPTPAAGPTLRLDYTYRPTPLSASNTSTWLTINTPDLLYYAGMEWLAGWTKSYGTGDDPHGAGHWETQYQAALAKALADEVQKKIGAI